MQEKEIKSTEEFVQETAEQNGELATTQEEMTNENTNGTGERTDDNDLGVDSSVVSTGDEVVKQNDRSQMREEFERLIKGDYKEFFEERIKENLNRRFKENARQKQKNQNNSEIVDMLYDKYNVELGDFEALKGAIESDDAYLAAQADKRGMSVEDYKYIRRLENDNRRYAARQMEYEAKAKASMAVEKWYNESMLLKESYPDFDIFVEANNPDFVALLKNGIDIKTAYEVVHHSELISRVAQDAAREAERKTTDAIRQRAKRPAENGLSSSSSALFRNSVSSLSPKEREEIAKRAARGETITF